MSKIVVIGDPHIGKSVSLGRTGTGNTLNSRIVDQFAILEYALERTVEIGAEHLFISGDVFDEPKPQINLITLFVSWLKQCQLYNINVHIIVGNHDVLRSGNVYTSPLDIISGADFDGVFVHKSIDTVFIDTTAFTFMPFCDRKSFFVNSNTEAIGLVTDSLVYELSSIPATYHKVVVGHLAIEGSIPVGDEIDDLTNELFCPLSMFTGYDRVIMGHVHKPQVMQKAPVNISHIGSMDISNFGEADQKKHIVIYDCLTGECANEVLPTRPLQKIVVTVPKDTPDSTAYVIEQINNADIQERGIVRVEVSLAVPELNSINKSTIDKYLMAHGAFYVSGITESKKVALLKKASSDGTVSSIDTAMDETSAIKTYAQTYIDEDMRQHFIDLSLSILEQLSAGSKE